MAFAEKVAGDASQVTRDDVERLREFGLSDAEITDVVLAVAARRSSRRRSTASARCRMRST